MSNILLVCTGNTCRSIMAEELMDDAIGRSSALRGRINVDSAGTFACEGQEPTEKAEIALEQMGIEMGKHKAKQVSEELVDWADLILVMEAAHVEQMEAMFPGDGGKVSTLLGYANGVYGFPGDLGYDVADPYGEPLEEYVECAVQLKCIIDKIVEKLEENIQ